MLKHLWWFFRPHRPQAYQPVVLVTGCSSGIGLALAHRLFKIREYRVVLTARGESLSKILKSGLKETDRFLIRPLDIKVGEQRQRLIEAIQRQWGGVDILINNAGISYRAVVEHMDESSELNQLRTNYLAPMALTRLVLPQMRARGRGKIINVSSVSGMLAMPTMSSYSASKFALEGATESLWYEMKPLGINVTLIQPGFINSKSFENVYHSGASSMPQDQNAPYADYYEAMAPFIARRMKGSWSTADSVAQKIIKVIRTRNPPLRVPATLDALLFYYMRRFLPRFIFHRLLQWGLPAVRRWGTGYSKSR